MNVKPFGQEGSESPAHRLEVRAQLHRVDFIVRCQPPAQRPRDRHMTLSDLRAEDERSHAASPGRWGSRVRLTLDEHPASVCCLSARG